MKRKFRPLSFRPFPKENTRERTEKTEIVFPVRVRSPVLGNARERMGTDGHLLAVHDSQRGEG